MKSKKWFILAVILFFVIVVIRIEWRFNKTRMALNGIEFTGDIIDKEDYGDNTTIIYLKLTNSSVSEFFTEGDYFVTEICDTVARIIFTPGTRVNGKTLKYNNYFEIGSTVKFNINGDGWFREYRNGQEVNSSRVVRKKRPYELNPFCK